MTKSRKVSKKVSKKSTKVNGGKYIWIGDTEYFVPDKTRKDDYTEEQLVSEISRNGFVNTDYYKIPKKKMIKAIKSVLKMHGVVPSVAKIYREEIKKLSK